MNFGMLRATLQQLVNTILISSVRIQSHPNSIIGLDHGKVVDCETGQQSLGTPDTFSGIQSNIAADQVCSMFFFLMRIDGIPVAPLRKPCACPTGGNAVCS